MKFYHSVPLALIAALNIQAGSKLITSGGSATATIQFTLDSYTIDTVTVDGMRYSRVRSSELDGITLEKGFPELPYSAEAVRLLKNGDAELKISNIKYKEIPALPVLPSKGMVTRDINPASIPAVEGSVYTENRFWPAEAVVLDSPYLIRETRGVAARIFPVAYNGATGKIRIAEEITFSVIETGTSVRSTSEDQSEEFRSLQGRFVNGNSAQTSRYTPVQDGNKMAIITTDEFKEAAEQLALWKNKKGIASTIYTYPTETGTGSAALKTFLKGLYTQNKITYVTIIGDHEDVPSEITTKFPSSQSAQDATVAADPSYTFLNGTDVYPDVFVGRLSVETAASAMTVVNKILTYEMKPEIGAGWYSKSVSIGSNEGTPKDYMWLADSINPVLKKSFYTSVDEIKQGLGGTTADLSNYINEGRGLINFMGHGNNDGFGFSSGFWMSSSLVQKLANGNKLPVVIPLACQYGAFSGRTVAAEMWQRHATGGAIVTMGSSPLQDWTPPQYAQVEMNRLIAKNTHQSVGAYFYNGEMRMLDIDVGSGTKTVSTWNYFGDPSVALINKAPTQIKLTVTSKAPTIGDNTITVSGPEGTQVTLYSKELKIHTSAIIKGSSIDMKYNASGLGKIYLTGTARNGAPHLDSIIVREVVGIVADNAKTLKEITVKGISAKQITVGVPMAGTYTIALFGLNGRKIFEQASSLSVGFQSIPLNEQNAFGPVIMQIQGPAGSFVTRAILK